MELARQALVVDPGKVLDIRGTAFEQGVELAGPDHAEAKLGRKARRLEHDAYSLERDQLADEQHREWFLRPPPGREEALLRSDEAHVDGSVGELCEEPGLRVGVGNDEIGGAERATVDELEHACDRRAGAKTCA